MNISKFEALGIGVSIIAMSVALFVMRTENIDTNIAAGTEQQAAVVTTADENRDQARANAIVEASDGSQVTRLIIDDISIGSGAEVAVGDTVTVNYIGTLQNGEQFANTYLSGEPFTFRVGDQQVIDGWNEGVVGMREGGERIIVVPPELAYGRSGSGIIPGNATLVFALELESVE